MTKEEGRKVADRLFNEGYTISGWARANGFKLRTVNDVLYKNLGSKRPGGKTGEIIAALKESGFLE